MCSYRYIEMCFEIFNVAILRMHATVCVCISALIQGHSIDLLFNG